MEHWALLPWCKDSFLPDLAKLSRIFPIVIEIAGETRQKCATMCKKVQRITFFEQIAPHFVA
ncbi:hypothetical protein [Paramuribaculum intestinale]|uniref:hypothetical protein n=1 Tax=Paramuribaculum intestinale TaxID=2094151 RepID=UPI0025B598FA|nr:hypothetical protein [Paramuribaculum intestinale]MCX4337098.1 hypothetical protein [Bacteroidales bacterium]